MLRVRSLIGLSWASADHGSNWQRPTPERIPSPCSEHSDNMSQSIPDLQTVRMYHSSDSIQVEAAVSSSADYANVERCLVSRTARKLFEGKV